MVNSDSENHSHVFFNCFSHLCQLVPCYPPQLFPLSLSPSCGEKLKEVCSVLLPPSGSSTVMWRHVAGNGATRDVCSLFFLLARLQICSNFIPILGSNLNWCYCLGSHHQHQQDQGTNINVPMSIKKKIYVYGTNAENTIPYIGNLALLLKV